MSIERAVLAGGCFWGMQDLFRKQKGVMDTRVGYTGGSVTNPTYTVVKTGSTRHAEAIAVTYHTEQTNYREILEFFFQIHDPTTRDRQGNDVGTQYRSAIFYETEEEKQIAEELIAAINAAGYLDGPIVTEVVPLDTFYDAEEDHQDYLEKNPGGYTCHFVRGNWRLPDKAS